jgi:hypothetical protein
MSQRIVVGLAAEYNWSSLKQALSDAGAQSIAEPSTQPLASVLVTIADAAAAPAFIERVSQLAGVRYAEADVLVTTGPLIKP